MAGTYEKTSSSVQEQFHSQVIPFPDTFSQKNHETENSFLFLFSWHFLFLFRQIPLFSISVSPFASKSFNNVCIVIAMIIVYKLFSQLHLITNLEVFRLRTIYLRTHFMWRKFFWLIEIKKNDIQVFFSEKSTGSFVRSSAIDRSCRRCLYDDMIQSISQWILTVPTAFISRQFTVLGLCLISGFFCSLEEWH